MFWIVTGLIFLAALVGIVALTRMASGRRPEGSGGLHTRDQIMAQTRAFTGQGHQPDEPSWDGQERGPVPDTRGGGGG